MDPNVLLKNMMETARRVLNDYEDMESNGVDQDDAGQLAEQIIQMDNWIAKGGFLPTDWVYPKE